MKKKVKRKSNSAVCLHFFLFKKRSKMSQKKMLLKVIILGDLSVTARANPGLGHRNCKLLGSQHELRFELGRPAANTKLGSKRVRTVRTMGGNRKFRALRLETGNFAWASEGTTRKTRILDVVYNASNNELVRTKTLVKNCIIQVDSTPFRQWYEAHYGVTAGRKRKVEEKTEEEVSKSNHVQRKIDARKPDSKIGVQLDDQFSTGRLYACVASRPGQSGRCDGYILEGKELEFYQRKLATKKSKK